jgi:hypothetical protein
MRSFVIQLAYFIIFLLKITFSQTDSIEVYLMDSFIPPDNPSKFYLSFTTSDICKSKVVFNGYNEFSISNELTDNHRTEIDVISLKNNTNKIQFTIVVEDSLGRKNLSESYEVDIPIELDLDTTKNYFLSCFMGGVVFLVPSISYISLENKNYFGFNKEIPLLSFFSGGYNYPLGHFSIEYSHIPKFIDAKNLFRFGYKHIYEIEGIEYLSAGVNGFTNFKGLNGISPELSIGFFRIFEVFTLYGRYRYNFKPGDITSEFSEFSVGLYASFFTIHL